MKFLQQLKATARRWRLMGIDCLLYVAVFGIGYPLCRGFAADTTPRAGIYFASVACFGLLLFVCRFTLRIYRTVWRFPNVTAYFQLVAADACAFLLGRLLVFLLPVKIGFFWHAALCAAVLVLTLLSRFAYQRYYQLSHMQLKEPHKIGVAIVGAGQVGVLLAQELQYHPASHYTPLCFIDTDRNKIGNYICGLKVYPECKETLEMLKEQPIAEIFLTVPNCDGQLVQRLYNDYSQTKCKVKIYDFPIKDDIDPAAHPERVIREVQIEDLLFRQSLHLDAHPVQNYLSGKIVMVTGGGGSIGSEIARQIAACSPKMLVLVDIYENNAYDIQQELLQTYHGALPLAVEIASVRDPERMRVVFAQYHPQVVFHAAAHKHVPLMEHSCTEAIKNNVFGTYHTANLAEEFGVEKFVLISTDKAVNPTNIMGASKRMCEQVIQCRTDSATSFAAVRFGNVLGSNGSVIPLFKRQIAQGGPVTITDPRIIRYFMTIPEAASLVLTAATMAKSGELFVLDMGKPVKILELAENMIRLCGKVPYEEIPIIFTGLRPGEKLWEELLIKQENMTKTENDLIFVEHDTPLPRAQVEEKLQVLKEAVAKAEKTFQIQPIFEAMHAVVETYHDPETVNADAEKAEEMRESGALAETDHAQRAAV